MAAGYSARTGNLYLDSNKDGIIDDIFGGDGPTLADVDNYPFGWREGLAPKGPEDIDRNSNGIFDAGDAIQIVTTDSWDDSKPTGSIGPNLNIHGETVPMGMDAYATWNQIRPGIFDGGYAFNSYFPGGIASESGEVDGLPTNTYIVEATTPPGYELVKEEDKNVDFGEAFIPSPLLLPPVLVGDMHLVPAELTLFPGVPCEFAGQMRPLADRKQIIVSPRKNAAADFFFFTEVPKAARGVGFANNDLGAEFNQWSPNFGEKIAPAWIPVSLRDWTGTEFHRIYTDEFGCYNFLLHSTYNINVPAPSGVGPQMMTLVLNDPIKPDGTIDEFYNPMYSITPWTFQYYPGSTSYLDTPLVPMSAFAPADIKLDTEPGNTPVIFSLDGPGAGFGPVINTTGGVITIQSKSTVMVLNPAYDPNVPGSPFRVSRNYGFGATQGQVLLNGAALAINSWNDATIEAVIPPGSATGQIKVVPGDNVIQYNTIIFNEDHFGALLAAAGDGGGIYIGGDVAGGTGAGNVTINSNLIQGNMTGSGYGGGIRAFAINAADVLESPDNPNDWYTLNIFNNIIVNNVAALGGAGISLQDVAKANIVNNTIANNDCTATAALAFTAGQANSTPQPSGVVSAMHSDLLTAMFGAGVQQTYSRPLLENNIIWHNRSWYNDASLNGGMGGLVARPGSPYWDLAVLGSTTSGHPHLTPENCLLTSLTDSETGYNYI